jgi:Holliday junction resolvase
VGRGEALVRRRRAQYAGVAAERELAEMLERWGYKVVRHPLGLADLAAWLRSGREARALVFEVKCRPAFSFVSLTIEQYERVLTLARIWEGLPVLAVKIRDRNDWKAMDLREVEVMPLMSYKEGGGEPRWYMVPWGCIEKALYLDEFLETKGYYAELI